MRNMDSVTWTEGRNLKEEKSKKVKCKHRKDRSIRKGIEGYFKGSSDEDDDFLEKDDDFLLH